MGLEINIGVLVAQIVNFLIIAYILQRYLYKPVISMLDKRKKSIEDGLALKESLEKEKGKQDEKRKKLMKDAQNEGQRIIAAAIVEAKKEEERIVKKATLATQEEYEKRMALVEKERAKSMELARREAISYAVLISEKMLEVKLTKSEQERLLKEALERIKQA